MSNRKKDISLANAFTATTHSRLTAAIDPSANKLPNPLNVLVIGAANLLLAARASSEKELASVMQRARNLAPSVPVTCLPVDITSSESVRNLVQIVKEKIGRLDVLVLNSGYSGPVVLKIDEGDPQDFRDVFDVNVNGTYLVAHHFLPLLRESGGAKTFIVVNSLATMITSGHIANTAYCLSKLAQARLMEYVAEQYGNEEVFAIAVHPGAVLTEMAEQTAPESIMQYLTDDPGLCGAFCVWLSHEKRMWLNGRLISATWDVDELSEKRSLIENEDLLKIGFRIVHSLAARPSQS
ncbi:NAD(P)-binding protein [Didymella exigua CBS 183.55]|uniref:NAD(P)-binding protein n=1 Tax=Didymella exigua CBS 183.55 TaxID=1150837 RepID=A0A6A5S4Z8_9PLEO|nr:NAD(P)-binding protein [Didymella exigua CBS 183.55]KAF1933566.1 NAD(P)-binding protein [Didymella exigua CBS 183.55]